MAADNEFDIRTPVGRQALAERHVRSDRDDTLQVGEIAAGLTSLVNHLGSRDWMVWRYGGFVLPAGAKHQRLLAVPEAVELSAGLQALSHCENFSALLGGFDNPTQFDDALFEVRIARWCVERPTVKRLQFAPRYGVLGRPKRPDFELQTPIGRLVCECKRLHLHSQDWNARLIRIADAFGAAMQAANTPADIRLEVVINHAIHGNLQEVTNNAYQRMAGVAEGAIVEVGPFSLRLSRVGSPVLPTNCVVQHGRIRVGSTPTGILPETNYLRVSSAWMEHAIVRTMGALINVAHRQLPHTRPGVIFVDGPREPGRRAAAARLIQAEYAHCIAIGVFRGNEIDFSRRNIDEPIVDWLFLGKRPPLSQRLRYIVEWRSGLRIAGTRKILRRPRATSPDATARPEPTRPEHKRGM
jgi:hypothetical protein